MTAHRCDLVARVARGLAGLATFAAAGFARVALFFAGDLAGVFTTSTAAALFLDAAVKEVVI